MLALAKKKGHSESELPGWEGRDSTISHFFQDAKLSYPSTEFNNKPINLLPAIFLSFFHVRVVFCFLSQSDFKRKYQINDTETDTESDFLFLFLPASTRRPSTLPSRFSVVISFPGLVHACLHRRDLSGEDVG